MDRTIIAPYKAEEKEMCEKLYNKLQGLILLYPGTDEFRKCISEDMFLKPNQNAFFQVMHYLFRLHDPAEFKKRFFWPITDKRSEANFRTATVDYLKHLNEKHQLQWTNIKSYLVVMPGGMKFITFLLDLVGFIVQELTRQREKFLFGDGQVCTAKKDAALNIERMKQQNSFLKEFASSYITELDFRKEEIKEKAKKVEQAIDAIALNVAIPKEQLMSDEFLENIEKMNEKLYQVHYVENRKKVEDLDSPIGELRNSMNAFLTKKSKIEYDENAVRSALKDYEQPACDREGITMNLMLKAFNLVQPQIAENLDAYNVAPISSEFIRSELESLKSSTQQTERDLMSFLKTILTTQTQAKPTDENLLSTPMGNKSTQIANTNQLLSKLVSTPPIQWDLNASSRRCATRFALLDDTVTRHLEPSNSFLLAPPTTVRRQKRNESIFDPNSSAVQKNKLIDPRQLLRTISKDKNKSRNSSHHNLSSLGTKWKQRQNLLSNDFNDVANSSSAKPKSPHLSPITTKQNTLTPSPKTPFNTNERTLMPRALNLNESAHNSSIVAKKSFIQKVQDESLQFHNLSTSPSGRLVPLVTTTELDLAKLQLNVVSEQKQLPGVSTPVKDNDTQDHSEFLSNKENQQNLPNLEQQPTPKSQKPVPLLVFHDATKDEDDFQLFNTSDTVLNDVLM